MLYLCTLDVIFDQVKVVIVLYYPINQLILTFIGNI